MGIHNNWREFLAEGKFVTADDKLLREVTEDELDHIARALHVMKPEDLAFNKIFKEKNRVLIDFPTRNEKSELGKFIAFFRQTGYEVDWDKGLLSGTITIDDTSPTGMANRMSNPGRMDFKPKKKKVQMKVGKFLSKLKRDIEKYLTFTERLKDWLFKEGPYRDGVLDARNVYTTYMGRMTGNDIKDALDDNEKDVAEYYRLKDQIQAYVGQDYGVFLDITLPLSTGDRIVGNLDTTDRLAKYWQQNADFIKNNLNTLTEDKYAIMITRHPVDILRMSDFDDISSCHSPPSRPQAMGAEYKCAVAEAHGHGALAYVVDKSDLDQEFGTTNLKAIEESSAFQQNQDFFYDDARDAGAEVEPISRLRLRQIRYWDDIKASTSVREPRTGEGPGTQLAVPERRVYGVDIPGFRNRVMEWAIKNQQEQLTNVPKVSNLGLDAINFNHFIKYGGSYEDTFIGPLTKDLFKNFDESYRDEQLFVGNIAQDLTTQRDLEKRVSFNAAEQLEAQIQELAGDDPRRQFGLSHFDVQAHNYDLEDGRAFVEPMVIMGLAWPAEQWKSLPNNLDWIIDDFGEFGKEYEIFQKHGRSVWAERSGQGTSFDYITLHMKLDLPSFNDGLAGFGFEEFEELLLDLDQKENGDWLRVIRHIATRSLRRENIFEGGQFDHVAWEIDNRDFDSGQWTTEVDGEGEISEYEMAVAGLRTEVVFANLGIDLETAKTIVSSKEFMINLRTELIKRVREQFDDLRQVAITPPGMDLFVDEALPNETLITFKITFEIGEDDKDSVVDVWRKIIETTPDAETVDKLSQSVFNMFARSFASAPADTEKPSLQEHRKIKLKNQGREQRMYDKWRRFLK